jgi:mRNA interferase RelE/StbE
LAWRVEVSKTADKQISKLDRPVAAAIIRYLRERVLALDNPRGLGKALHGEKKGLWRYRVGDYRIICDIQDEAKTVTVLALGHRKEIYR